MGNSSTAAIATTGGITIGDGAQQGAKGVNLVNTADTSVANGVNVWDGRTDLPPLADVPAVQQSNSIAQDQSRSASLPSYVRTGANVDSSHTETSTTQHTGSVDTKQVILGQEIKAGEGVSIAGQVDANLTGGNVGMTNHLSGSFTGQISGSAGSGLFGGISTSAKTTVHARTDQTLSWVLPDLTLSIKGAGCFVEVGSCKANGSYADTTTDTTATRSPFMMKDASAEYIVVDGSTLHANNDYNVALSGSAQSQAQAVNLVNAAGSAIANAVNVARAPQMGANLNLSQVNTIVQRR